MPLLIKDILHLLSDILPLQSAGYEKDAVGLQVGNADGEELRRVLVAYEITDEVIDEAEQVGANLIISYHPLIYPSLTAITDSTRTGALVQRLVRSQIALYVVHTAFDTNQEFGTSRQMADALGLTIPKSLSPLVGLLEKIVVFVPKDSTTQVQEAMWKTGAGNIGNYDECSFTVSGEGSFRGGEGTNPAIGKPLVCEKVDEVRLEMITEKWKTWQIICAMIAAHPYEQVAYDIYPLMNRHPKYGMGTVGVFPEALSPDDLLKKVRSAFGTTSLRHNGVNHPVKKVALLGGAGMEYYSAAKAAGAEAFITGDIRYHDFYRAVHDNILLIDAGHAETERFVTQGIMAIMGKVIESVNLSDENMKKFVTESRLRPNIVHYY